MIYRGAEMNVTLIYMVVVLASLVLGFLLMNDFCGARELVLKKKSSLLTGIRDQSGDLIFQSAGVRLSLRRYNAIRDAGLILISIIALAELFGGDYGSAAKTLGYGALIAFVTYPKERVFGRRSLFKMALDLLRKSYLESKDLELMSVITQMKNLSVSNRDKPISAVFMLKELMRFTKITKPVFGKTTTLLIRDGPKEASLYFADTFGTRLGENFATVILKLDELNPVEFTAQLELFQISIRELKKTRKNKRQENEANLMFVLASLQVLIITMNFIMMVIGGISYQVV